MCPTVVYRADAIAAAGAFDTHYRFVADWEWLLRLQAKGWQLAAVSQPLVSYRRHAEQATHREAESLRRYREEHAVLTHAREFGVSDGLLPEHARSTAMRDNLLFDAFGDLQARRPDAARDKLRLLGHSTRRRAGAHRRARWRRQCGSVGRGAARWRPR